MQPKKNKRFKTNTLGIGNECMILRAKSVPNPKLIHYSNQEVTCSRRGALSKLFLVQIICLPHRWLNTAGAISCQKTFNEWKRRISEGADELWFANWSSHSR